VHESISDLNEVGPIVSQYKDMYQCAAKRYFQYFTGIDIELYDPGDPANYEKVITESKQTKEVRGFIESLGAQLQSHQSLRALIKSIMASKYYAESDYLP
jgi:hypothetical protein